MVQQPGLFFFLRWAVSLYGNEMDTDERWHVNTHTHTHTEAYKCNHTHPSVESSPSPTPPPQEMAHLPETFLTDR